MRLPIVLLLSLLAAGCDRQKAQTPQAGPSEAAAGELDRSHAGEAAPLAAFKDPDGDPVTLAAFEGRPLLVNLWATWCAPCIAEMPTLDALAGRGGNLQVLAISQDFEGQEQKVAAFFEDRKLKHLEAYQDPQLAMMEALDASVLPTTILYDSRGIEVWRMTGAADWTGAKTASLIAEAR